MDWDTYKQMRELAKAQENIPKDNIERKLQQYKVDEISEEYTNKRPFKTKNPFKGYLGTAIAYPTLYSILNNPAYSMQQKAENILIEGANYVPIYGDLKPYIDINNIKPIRYNTNTTPTRGVGFYEREP